MDRKFPKFIIILNKLAVAGLLVLSVFNLIWPLLFMGYGKSAGYFKYFEIHHTISRFLGFTILLVSWKLYKRISAAWNITMTALSLWIFQFVFIHHDKVTSPMFLIEVAFYFILLLSRNYYCRKADRYSLKKSIIIFGIYAAFVFFNAVIAHLHEKNMMSVLVCIEETVDIMFGTENTEIYPRSFYHGFIFYFSWLCIFSGLIFLLTPYISRKKREHGETEAARELVKKYGQNCSSYTTLESDKNYFFSKSGNAFIAYGIVRDVITVLGDPVCAPGEIDSFLGEIKTYCEENAYSIIFMNTTDLFLGAYKRLGFGCVKSGEEPRFYLPEYNISGGGGAKMRANINHATKAGITVKEYKPVTEHNPDIEKQLTEASQEWLDMKKSGELVFTMGSISFDNPMDRRYFYAENAAGKIEGFIVFVPFAAMNGYMADVTRHCKDATRGIMEKIFYEAMMTFKSENVKWGSMAVAPLARLENETDITAKLLNAVYEKMNSVYGFKALYQTKLKYNPTCWISNYYVYYPAVFTPAQAYAIIRIQNPLGIIDYAKSFFHIGKKQLRNKDIRF